MSEENNNNNNDNDETIVIPAEGAPVVVQRFKTEKIDSDKLMEPQTMVQQDYDNFIIDIFKKNK